jgi:mono/diheme cytochrome c family protein
MGSCITINAPRYGRALFRGLCASILLMSSTAIVPAQQNAGQNAQGSEIYRQSGCVVCHGGFGTGGFGPKLSGDPLLIIEPFVVAQIILGRGQMPPFGDKLSDEQIAAVAHYIRNSWGNDFGPVTPKDVADTRQLLKRAEQTQARLSKAQQ